jgi:hypothetical protein
MLGTGAAPVVGGKMIEQYSVHHLALLASASIIIAIVIFAAVSMRSAGFRHASNIDHASLKARNAGFGTDK